MPAANVVQLRYQHADPKKPAWHLLQVEAVARDGVMTKVIETETPAMRQGQRGFIRKSDLVSWLGEKQAAAVRFGSKIKIEAISVYGGRLKAPLHGLTAQLIGWKDPEDELPTHLDIEAYDALDVAYAHRVMDGLVEHADYRHIEQHVLATHWDNVIDMTVKAKREMTADERLRHWFAMYAGRECVPVTPEEN